MSLTAVKFVLVGPRAGQTVELAGRRFTDGVHTHLVAAVSEVGRETEMVAKRLAYESAFLDGSPAKAAAELAWARLMGAEAAELIALESKANEQPALPPVKPEEPKEPDFENQKLVDAIRSLDPADNKHWTKEGLPMIGPVEKAYGQGSLNRQAVAEALPGWNRETAVAWNEQKAVDEAEALAAAAAPNA